MSAILLLADQILSIGEAFKRGIAPALMRTEIDYVTPVRFPDVVQGRMWLAESSQAKWILGAEFTSRTSRMVTAKAKQIGVFVSIATLRPVRLPDEFRQLSQS